MCLLHAKLVKHCAKSDSCRIPRHDLYECRKIYLLKGLPRPLAPGSRLSLRSSCRGWNHVHGGSPPCSFSLVPESLNATQDCLWDECFPSTLLAVSSLSLSFSASSLPLSPTRTTLPAMWGCSQSMAHLGIIANPNLYRRNLALEALPIGVWCTCTRRAA